MIKLAILVVLIFNLDFINAEPMFEYEFEKPFANDTESIEGYIFSKLESEVENFIKNLMTEKTSGNTGFTGLSSVSRQDPRVFDDIYQAVKNIDLGQILISSSLCSTFIPKFDIAPLMNAVATICYS